MPNYKKNIQHRTTIINSKLLKPKISDDFINRDVVHKLVDKIGTDIRAAMVIAPAGYGKSVLLTQTLNCLEKEGYHCHWLSIDNKDNDPLRLLSHIISLLGSKELIERHLTGGYFIANRKTTIDYIISDIANYLEQNQHNNLIFIDDYHLINNAEIHSIFERLILYVPHQTVFVISSRNEPKLSLTTFKLREEIFWLTVEDLAFEKAEANEFLNSHKQLSLNKSLVNMLTDKTEGWIAGLQLASLALKNIGDHEQFIAEFTGSDRDVTSYLVEVILSSQSDEIKHFLLWTSVLERMNADLINTVLSSDNAQKMLEHIERKNLFVIPLDRQRYWYRYHHLFSDFLRTAFEKEYPETAQLICKRAQQWCISNDYIHDAINYCIAGKNYQQALEFISEISKKIMLETGEVWTLLNWLEQIPRKYVVKFPEIGIAYSWSLIFNRQPYESEEQLRQIEENLTDDLITNKEKLKLLQSNIAVNRFLIGAVIDDTVRCNARVKKWLAENPGADVNDRISGLVVQAYTSLSTFDFTAGLKACQEAFDISTEFYLTSWVHSAEGLLFIEQGDLFAAEKTLSTGLACNNKYSHHKSYMGSLNSVGLANVYYEQNELDKAEALLEDKFEYIDSVTVITPSYLGYKVLANLQRINTGLDEAIALLKLGIESAEKSQLPRLKAMLIAKIIHFLLQDNQLKAAQATAKQYGFIEHSAPLLEDDQRIVYKEIKQLSIAELNLHNNLPAKALTTIEVQIQHCQEFGRGHRLLTLRLLQCRALKKLERKDEALTALIQAIKIATFGQYYRTFIDAGSDVHSLLRSLLKDDTNKLPDKIVEFVGKINTLLNLTQHNENNESSPEIMDTLLEPMTKRERQMLDFIKTGETNKDIADKLFISEQTVKWHLHQLYKKLGVKNRTSAIAKASALQLI